MAARAAELALLAVLGLPRASAHGAVTRPSPRRLASSPFCPWCIGEHHPLANPWGVVNRSVELSHPCMGTSRADRAYTPAEFSHYAGIAEEASGPYVVGEPFEATVVLDADHNGDARWSYCPHSEAETEACFGRAGHLLTEWTDVHAYWGEASTQDHGFDGRHFPQTVLLPASVPQGRVTLRWQWVCKWTDEAFVSCIDVDVTAGSSVTAPLPTSTPTSAPTSAPTAAPTRVPTAAPVPPPVAAPSPAPTPVPSPVPTTAPTTAPRPSQACAGVWQKCGGRGWAGPACCTAGLTCTFENAWDSKCLWDERSGPCSGSWAQCGGEGWGGPTCCQPGLRCDATSEHYSQCRPEGTVVLARIRGHHGGFLAQGPALLQAQAAVRRAGAGPGSIL